MCPNFVHPALLYFLLGQLGQGVHSITIAMGWRVRGSITQAMGWRVRDFLYTSYEMESAWLLVHKL